MLTFIGNVGTQINVIFSEITRLGTYLDAYPVIYYILCLSMCLEAVIALKHITKL